ncbi:glycosyltransferase [Pseudomonas syringae]|nr:glycosyltransferase [Pseudomonas syringae]
MTKYLLTKEENSSDTELDYLRNLESKAVLSNTSPTQFLWGIYDKQFASNTQNSNYESWQQQIEIPSQPLKALIRKKASSISKSIKFSIVLPTYNTPEKYLRKCIESVTSQSFQNWELCIADDASTSPNVKKVLEEYRKKDSRIKVFYREKNGHISLASNSALELATGTHVALLDHDDELAENALFYFAELLHNNPKIEIAYSDEDKISESGQRYDPHFKSDWNPELIFSHNYISHLGVYKRSLIEKVKGFRQGVEGSQDYDLLLRCLKHVSEENIAHIPRILYHWRSIEGSTASAAEGKSYTDDAGQKALTDYFKAVNKAIDVLPGPVPNTYRVKWPLPKVKPLVSLIIPTRDRVSLVEIAVRSILEKTTYTNYEIIIIDNGSVEPETLEFFKKIRKETKKVKVFAFNKPFNYSEINNFGVSKSKGSIIGLVNNDVEVISPDWLDEMVRLAVRPEIGCVGAKLYYSNDTIQHAGVICSLGGVAGHSHKCFPRNHPGYFHRLVLPQALSAVTAACLLVKRKIFLAVDGLDEVNLKVAFNDVDFCLKVGAAGHRNVWTPYAELYHYESISRGAEDSPEKVERFNNEIAFMKNKWPSILSHDPYYNINLTKDLEDFSITSASYYQLEGF